MKIVYTMVCPVLVNIKWAPTTKINLHKHLNYNNNENFQIYGSSYSICTIDALDHPNTSKYFLPSEDG